MRFEAATMIDDRPQPGGDAPSRESADSETTRDYEATRPRGGGFDDIPTDIGKYRVVAPLDTGGQAVVYRVLHPGLAKELVLKLGRSPLASGPVDADALVAEGRLLVDLDHPSLTRVYDVDFHEGRPFIVMEYVRGRNLKQAAVDRRFTAAEAVALIAQAARGAAAAHARGVVHRDLKPQNILLDEAGRPRIIDFGLARFRDAWSSPDSDSGTVSGTAQYMAPEQARGEGERIDPRTDVFALGAVLYWLLTGTAPFAAATTRESLSRAARCDFDRNKLAVAGVAPALQAICLRAMAPEPGERYPSAIALAEALEPHGPAGGAARRKLTLEARLGKLGCLMSFSMACFLAVGGSWLFLEAYRGGSNGIVAEVDTPDTGPQTDDPTIIVAKSVAVNKTPDVPSPRVVPETITGPIDPPQPRAVANPNWSAAAGKVRSACVTVGHRVADRWNPQGVGLVIAVERDHCLIVAPDHTVAGITNPFVKFHEGTEATIDGYRARSAALDLAILQTRAAPRSADGNPTVTAIALREVGNAPSVRDVAVCQTTEQEWRFSRRVVRGVGTTLSFRDQKGTAASQTFFLQADQAANWLVYDADPKLSSAGSPLIDDQGAVVGLQMAVFPATRESDPPAGCALNARHIIELRRHLTPQVTPLNAPPR